ncbi:MAG: DUF4494 domain-containing protein [Bacteroidota bacterium]
MKIWYSCKVKFTKETEDGFLKQVSENYLVDAVSYTDAESRIYAIMEDYVRGEFSVASIAKTNLSEVINYEDEENWYKCKVTYSTVDADKGKEVKVTTYMLVSAAHVKQAFERVEDNLSSMLVPFDIPAINLTNFVEVFPLQSEEDIEPEIPDNFVRYESSMPASDSFEEKQEEEATVVEETEQNPVAGEETVEEEVTLPAHEGEEEEESDDNSEEEAED